MQKSYGGKANIAFFNKFSTKMYILLFLINKRNKIYFFHFLLNKAY